MSNFWDTQQAEAHWHIFQIKWISVERIEFTVYVCVVAHFFERNISSNLNHFTEKIKFFHRVFIALLVPCEPFCESAICADAIQLCS